MSFNMHHYYDKAIGPFKNLSMLTSEAAEDVSSRIRLEGNSFASQRSNDYMQIRRELESIARKQFIAKGGQPQNSSPHYMTLGACDWLLSWYINPGVIVIPWEQFLEESISFTYGDLFPTMRYRDDKPYRKQVYTRRESLNLLPFIQQRIQQIPYWRIEFG